MIEPSPAQRSILYVLSRKGKIEHVDDLYILRGGQAMPQVDQPIRPATVQTLEQAGLIVYQPTPNDPKCKGFYKERSI
jgi:hypothetical protein